MGGGLTTLDGGGLLHEFSKPGGGLVILPPAGPGGLVGASVSEDLVIQSAPFTDTVLALIPQDAVLLGVPTKVLVTIPGALTFDVGDPSLSFRFSTLVGATLGSKSPGTRSAAARTYTVATPIRITPSSVPPAATGLVRVTIYYYTIDPG